MKHASVVPLIGGLTVAATKATGVDPEFFISYPIFAKHEQNIKNYFPAVPHYLFDNDPSTTDSLKNANIDFMHAVCPCAGLSMLANSSPEHRSAMNYWLLNSAQQIMSEIRPRVFWGENAPGLYTSMGKDVRKSLYEIAQHNGYSFSIYLTNTNIHGIPQDRKRSFYFFWRDTPTPCFNYFNRVRKSLTDYLAEVTPGMIHHGEDELFIARNNLLTHPVIQFLQDKYHGKGIQQIRDHVKDNDHQGITIFNYLINTDQMKEATQWLIAHNHEREARETQRIIDKVRTKGSFWDQSFPYFDGDKKMMTLISRRLYTIHPTEDRIFTLRESMHLMGLPHDFELVSKDKNHICQNVPVTTGYDMAQEVIAVLDGKRNFSDATFMMQNNLRRGIEHEE